MKQSKGNESVLYLLPIIRKKLLAVHQNLFSDKRRYIANSSSRISRLVSTTKLGCPKWDQWIGYQRCQDQ